MNRAEIEARRDELGNLLVDASLVLDLRKPNHVTFPHEEREAVLQRIAAFQAFLAEIASQVKIVEEAASDTSMGDTPRDLKTSGFSLQRRR